MSVVPDWMVGVGLDSAATFAGCVGKQLLRYAALPGRSPAWYAVGLFFTGVIDPAFDTAAYSYAAASIVTACAGLLVVWNVLLAPYTLGEVVTPARKWGSVLIVIGTLSTAIFAQHEGVDRDIHEYLELFARPVACIWYVLLAIALGVCVYGAHSTTSEQMRGFYVSALAGLLAGNTFTTKASIELITSDTPLEEARH